MGCCGSKEEDRVDGHEALLPKKGKDAQRFEQTMAQKASALGYKTPAPATASTAPVTNGKRSEDTAKPVAPVSLAPTKPVSPPRKQPAEKPVVDSVDLLELQSDKAPSPAPSPVKPVSNAEQKAASPAEKKPESPSKPADLAASRASAPAPTEPTRVEPSPPKPVKAEPARAEPSPPKPIAKPASPSAIEKSPVVASSDEALVVSAFTLTESAADTVDDNEAADDNDNDDNDEAEEQQQQSAAAGPKKSGKGKSKRKKKKGKK